MRPAKDTVALVLAGGRGLRLWPLSTPERPKPFRALFGAEPLVARIVRQATEWLGDPSAVWLSIGETQLAAARAAIPNLDRHQLLLEDRPGETTAAIARAARAIAALRPETVILVLAADQRLDPDTAVHEAWSRAVSVARSGPRLVSLGVPPDRPSTAYGYMLLGAPIEGLEGAFEGLGYVEKPDAATAVRLFAERPCLWNAGIFAFRADTLLAALGRHAPAALDPAAPLRAIDYELMERVRPGDPERHAFIEARHAFADCGNHEALAEEAALDARGNRTRGEVIAEACDDCVLLCEAPRRLSVIGLSSMLVAVGAEGNVLVSSRASAPKPLAEAPLAVDLVSAGRGCVAERGPRARVSRARDCVFEGDAEIEIWARDVERLAVRVDHDEVSVSRVTTTPSANKIDLRACADEEQVAVETANLVVEILRAAIARRGKAVLVPSTGRTVVRCYGLLASQHRDALDWDRVEVVQMDELADVPEAFTARRFLAERLLDPLGICRVHLFDDTTTDEALRVERALVAAGPDLVIHGLGENGHLGLNEPGSAFDSAARAVVLSEDTRRSKRGQFGDREPPTHGVTLGLGALLDAPRSLLLATGEHKRRALSRALFEPVSRGVPASGVQLRGRVTVIADRAALP